MAHAFNNKFKTCFVTQTHTHMQKNSPTYMCDNFCFPFFKNLRTFTSQRARQRVCTRSYFYWGCHRCRHHAIISYNKKSEKRGVGGKGREQERERKSEMINPLLLFSAVVQCFSTLACFNFSFSSRSLIFRLRCQISRRRSVRGNFWTLLF